MCRFGIPYKLISDNGKYFDSEEVRELCDNLSIVKGFSAVSHPQTNGQIDNKIIKHNLKAKIEDSKAIGRKNYQMCWWSYNTTPRTTT